MEGSYQSSIRSLIARNDLGSIVLRIEYAEVCNGPTLSAAAEVANRANALNRL